MGIDIETEYPLGTDAASAAYPTGKPHNITAPGDGLGFPNEEKHQSDLQGFLQAIIKDGSITISGIPDTALASDYLDGLRVILLQRSELRTNPFTIATGTIPYTGNQLRTKEKIGLRAVHNTTSSMTTNVGTIRNQANTADLILPSAITKLANATWVVGSGNGGIADTVGPSVGQWIRQYIVNKPDGTADMVWDTSATAANFFASANAAAAGFSDTSLFGRYAWTQFSGATDMHKYINDADDTSRFYWDTPLRGATLLPVPSASRGAIVVNAPPNTLHIGQFNFDGISAGTEALITSFEQADTAVTAVNSNVRAPDVLLSNAQSELSTTTDSSSQVFARMDSVEGASVMDVRDFGWIDRALIA